ncbi:hydroxymethylglutaryl-CoA lyase [Niveispirillum cyanobacteriorum]|uniref:hydroxymethylglutaryl-CoA lyase n=1 Tax=Niveispirillum cyanobacteriorum TaxID=1612173 RepID=A0A2K9NIN2_9PROT|nr:hydroxymethylglutaryl-CoA lyase [Niveispirillum cyanobacteriorum]AUN32155.1 hydroxymethylglutaryl-CoA lyase [Niveispirillum cyanobacteriorum]GGE74752.1 hydroxymethylglutaryl-CoA lyase [Niveispirillum cyanobacteriorum]
MHDIRLVEVGPRDGLQNEKTLVPLATKVELVNRLSATGLSVVEAGAFVSPKWVPQMADSAEVMQAIARKPGITYPVLVPNEKGLEAALAVGVTEVAVFGAASEAFSQKNINCSIAESLDRFRAVIDRARLSGVKVRGYVSCVLGCPYEGAVDPGKVAEVAARLMAMGCYEVSLGDTIGVGNPRAARAMLKRVAEDVPMGRIALHFHDTYGQALANILACIELGARVFDGAVAGLGGCPYAKGASGNVATEDVLYMLNGMGLSTGVDLDALAAIGTWISGELNRPNGSKVGRALSAKG